MTAVTDRLPPGTEIIEASAGKGKVLLAPKPSNDPNQPLNWSTTRKTAQFTILNLYVLITFATLCVPVPLWQSLNSDLGFSYAELNTGYAIQVFGMAVGCMAFVPIALRYGLRSVHISMSLFLVVTALIWATMNNLAAFYVASLISSIVGCVNEALVPLVISELYYVHQRGTMNGIFLVITMLGNYMGPVAGGYIATGQSWRWTFWWCVIFQGAITAIMVLFLEETKWSPLSLEGRAVATGEEVTSIGDFKSKDEETSAPVKGYQVEDEEIVSLDPSIPMKTVRQRLAFVTRSPDAEAIRFSEVMRALYQPYQLLVTFPAIAFCAIQFALAILVIVFMTTTEVVLYPLPPYNFSPAGVGNMNIPPFIGTLIGAVFGGPITDWFILRIARKRGGVYEPETRLWLFLIPSAVLLGGTLLFGLTISKGQPWPLNAVGAALMGFGLGAIMDLSQSYAQDSYHSIVGEAFIPITFLRNAVAGALCFAFPPWMETVGPYWMTVTMTVIFGVTVLIVVPYIIWGRAWRIQLANKYEMFAAKHA